MTEPRILVAAVPCGRQFPEIQRELGRIAGQTPTGRDRIQLEWGGTATRPYGAGQENCKFGLYSEDVIIGYSFSGDPRRPKKRDRMDLQTDICDLDLVPDHIALFSDGTLRLAQPRFATIDHPIPNWFITDWLAPEQVRFGAYRHGYWHKIWRVFDPKTNEVEPFFGYRDPDWDDVLIAREYWHTKTHDLMTMGRHIDEPITGDDRELQDRWLNRAVKHLADERRGENVEAATEAGMKYLNEKYADIGHKPFVDQGASNVR